MSKWEDTVMSDDQLFKMIGVEYYCDHLHTITKVMKAQAEISFKAGVGEVVEWIRLHTDSICVGQDMETNAGNENTYGNISHLKVRFLEWLAKLKEWGMDQPSARVIRLEEMQNDRR